MTPATDHRWRLAEGSCQHCDAEAVVLNLTLFDDGRPPLVDAECRACGGANDCAIPDGPPVATGEHWHDRGQDCHDPDAERCRTLGVLREGAESEARYAE